MRKVLLLGASGFVGSNIAGELDRRGYEWLGVGRSRSEDGSRIVTLDDESEIVTFLRDRPIVINALGGLKPQDFVLDFGGAMEEFWRAVQQTLDLLREGSPSLLLQISSAGTVYGEAPGRPSDELDAPAPRSWYGRMKVVEEALYQQYAHEFNVMFTCARVTNPFGNENHPTHGLVDVLIDHVRRDEPFHACFREGACRDFIYAPEMAKTLVAMAERPKPGVFNVGRGESVPLEQLIKVLNKQAPWAKIKSASANESDVAVSAVSTRKLIEAYEIYPEGPSAIEYLQNKLSQVRL
jgi:UDP-glucose 4-epimerase